MSHPADEVVYRASDPKRGMALHELTTATEHATKWLALEPESRVRVTMGWRGQLQELRVEPPKGTDR